MDAYNRLRNRSTRDADISDKASCVPIHPKRRAARSWYRFMLAASLATLLLGASVLSGCAQGDANPGSSGVQTEATAEESAEEQQEPAEEQQAGDLGRLGPYEEQQTPDEQQYTEETLPPDAYQMAERDHEMVYNYRHSDVMDDGLTASEIANSMGYESLQIAVNSEGTNEVAAGIRMSIQDMGYSSGSSWEMKQVSGKTALYTNYGSSLSKNRLLNMNVFTFIQDADFFIQLSIKDYDTLETICSYEYDSDIVPTPDDALRLLEERG